MASKKLVNAHMNNLLSICIPTYNRSVFLKKNLDFLIPLCSKFQIPIYISDNCSDDNTHEVVLNKKKTYNNIFYKKLNSNKGIDFNMDSVVKMSTNEYCWIFSDDDIIHKQSIEYLLKIIEENNKPDFILLSSLLKNLEDDKLIETLNLTENEYEIISSNDLLKKHAVSMTLLSACIVRKELWQKIKYESYTSKYYFHIHNILNSCRYSNNILVIGRPLFTRYHGNDWNFKKNEISLITSYFYPLTLDKLSSSFSYYSKYLAIKNKRNARISLKILFILRMRNIVSIFNFPKTYFLISLPLLPIIVMCLLMPAFIFKFFYKYFLHKYKPDWV